MGLLGTLLAGDDRLLGWLTGRWLERLVDC